MLSKGIEIGHLIYL